MGGFDSPLSERIWRSRYQADGEPHIASSWQRVATALAAAEIDKQSLWLQRFLTLLQDFRFLPGGRILAGAGVERDVTLFNCFVMGAVPDDMAGIFDSLKEGALTLQQGGGVGYDFSTLRPAGLYGMRVGGIASGPVSFMGIWDSMCATLLSTAARRGAMMATLRCDHPDIERFIDAKRDPRALRHFNLSVLITDAFMQAVDVNDDWALVFPVDNLSDQDRVTYPQRLERRWSGSDKPVQCALIRRVRARDLWRRIMQANYDTAEPGVLFIDRINRENNLYYREWISATNPCGEIPLPNYGACDLGSLNLTRFVLEPFGKDARMDLAALADATATATRLLDNVIDVSRFPLPVQRDQAQGSRRIGLGITGLADALIMLGLRYDSDSARQTAAAVMRCLCHTAYRASVALAREKGSFPFLVKADYLAAPFVTRLPSDIRDGIATHGIRNSHLTAIAPAGTISLLANNISSGVEPVFRFHYRRRLRDPGGHQQWEEVQDDAARGWQARFGDKARSSAFVDAGQLTPADHLAMQAVVQTYVDGAISKTINLPQGITFADFEEVYRQAYRLGLKGCTIFRPNPVTGAVLEASEAAPDQPEAGRHCCGLDSEVD